jgi:hypothetical protein
LVNPGDQDAKSTLYNTCFHEYVESIRLQQSTCDQLESLSKFDVALNKNWTGRVGGGQFPSVYTSTHGTLSFETP